MDLYEEKLSDEEHRAWQVMFAKMCDAFGLTREQLNDPKYKTVFHHIEVWAIAYFKLRERQLNGHPELRKEYLTPFHEE